MTTLHELRRVAQAGKDRDPAWYRAHRRLSFPLTRLALRAGVEAGHVSAAMMVAGAAGVFLVARPSLGANLAGFALLYLSFLLDKMDGEIARCRRTESLRGILLDRFHHRLIEPLVFVAAGVHELGRSGSSVALIAGLVLMALANVIEEQQQLAPYIAFKHVRDGRRALPPPVPLPPGRARALARARALLRPLKGFRMLIVMVPLLILAVLGEQVTPWPWVQGVLVSGAVGLGAYLVFQCLDLGLGTLDVEAHNVVDTLADPSARPPRESMR